VLQAIKHNVFTTCQCGLVIFTVVSVCASLCSVRALTLESLGLETSFLHAGTSSVYLAQGRVSRSWSQGQGHTSHTHARTHTRGLRVKGNLVNIIL